MLRLKGISIQIDEFVIDTEATIAECDCCGSCDCSDCNCQPQTCGNPDCPICNGKGFGGAIGVAIGPDGKPNILGDVPDFLRPLIDAAINTFGKLNPDEPSDDSAADSADEADETSDSAEAAENPGADVDPNADDSESTH